MKQENIDFVVEKFQRCVEDSRIGITTAQKHILFLFNVSMAFSVILVGYGLTLATIDPIVIGSTFYFFCICCYLYKNGLGEVAVPYFGMHPKLTTEQPEIFEQDNEWLKRSYIEQLKEDFVVNEERTKPLLKVSNRGALCLFLFPLFVSVLALVRWLLCSILIPIFL